MLIKAVHSVLGASTQPANYFTSSPAEHVPSSPQTHSLPSPFSSSFLLSADVGPH